MVVKEKMFPMQDGPDLTWHQAEKIYEVYRYLYGNSQSLERLAERGGFGWGEIGYMWNKFNQSRRNKGGKEPHEFFKWKK